VTLKNLFTFYLWPVFVEMKIYAAVYNLSVTTEGCVFRDIKELNSLHPELSYEQSTEHN